jgi:hypothetical protein
MHFAKLQAEERRKHLGENVQLYSSPGFRDILRVHRSATSRQPILSEDNEQRRPAVSHPMPIVFLHTREDHLGHRVSMANPHGDSRTEGGSH